MKCARCHQDNPSPAKFCLECGTPFTPTYETSPRGQSYADLQDTLTEALERERATGAILRVIASSPTTVEPVFDAILDSALRLCGSPVGVLFRFDGEMFRLVAHRGMADAFVEALRGPQRLGPHTGPARAVAERRPIHILDMMADRAYEERDPMRVRAVELQGTRTALFVPMLREGTPIGVLVIWRREVQAYSESQIQLLSTFAAQAVIAIENVRLFKELEARNRDLTKTLEQQTATSEILRVISSSPTDVQPVFDAVVDSAGRLCSAESAAVYRFEGEMAYFVAGYHFSSETIEAYRRQFPRPLRETDHLQRVLGGSVLNIADIENDPHTSSRVRDTYRSRGVRSTVLVPMLREGRAIGAIGVSHHDLAAFSAERVELLKSFANQAAIAIENVRLLSELQARNRDLTATSEILQVISRSPTDVQPVFDTIVRSAGHLCEATFSGVVLVDGDKLTLPATHGLEPEAMTVIREGWPRPLGLDTATGRAVLERRVVHIPDVQADPEYRYQQAPDARIRTIVAVPLLREGVPIGAIGVWRDEVRPFTDNQLALLQTFADQAVIAIENVRLFTELQEKNQALTAAHAQVTEALEQQTATSEILRVISSSPTELRPVMDVIAENAARVCGANDAHIYLVEGEILRRAAKFGDLRTGPAADTLSISRGRPAGRAVIDRQTVHVHDIAAMMEAEFPEARTTAGAFGSRTILVTPLLREGVPVGVILIRRMEVQPFSDTQIGLLKTFADQAVIAIENVRLFNELQERTRELARSVEELKALGEVGQAVSSTLNLETVLTTIAARADQLSGTDGAAIYEFDEASGTFHLRVALKLEEELLGVLRARPTPLGEGVVGRVGLAREPVQIPDIMHDQAYQGPLREVALQAGNRALLAVPLLREDFLVGALVVRRRAPGRFPEETVKLLQTFATQSVLAIQNARLFREIADTSRQLEAASRHKSEFLANMSHELRTPLNAIIGFSEVLAERMFGEVNEKQAEYLQDILASGRHLLSLINDILDLSKVEAGRLELELASFHLPVALDNALALVRERATRHGITLDVAVDAGLGEVVGDERKIRQILLNLLSNAVKFTPEGGRVAVAARPTDGVIEISVSDTGIGISPEDQATIFEEFRQVGRDDARKQEGTGLGLTLAKKFVELHGGRIWVRSQVGQGSTFTFTLPVRAEGTGSSE